jgi:hypothetical protein
MTRKNVLWPYGIASALIAMVGVWLGFAVVLLLSHNYTGWPNAASATPLLPLVVGIGLIPLALYLVDYAAGMQAVVGIAGVKVDFSRAGSIVTRASIELPSKIGYPGPLVSDSSALQIVQNLWPATAAEVVRLDLGQGEEWWVTRLLVFASGAVRAGMPQAFVFLGTRHSVRGAFLGWARPPALLDALRTVERKVLNPPSVVTYGQLYDKAVSIARQVTMFKRRDVPQPPYAVAPPAVSPLPPNVDVTMVLGADVRRYLDRPDYLKLGEEVQEQILMDQIGLLKLEEPPDQLTLGRLEELFGHCLNCEAIDLTRPKSEQVKTFFETEAPYIALVNRGRYEAIVERTVAEREILRQLAIPAEE